MWWNTAVNGITARIKYLRLVERISMRNKIFYFRVEILNGSSDNSIEYLIVFEIDTVRAIEKLKQHTNINSAFVTQLSEEDFGTELSEQTTQKYVWSVYKDTYN